MHTYVNEEEFQNCNLGSQKCQSISQIWYMSGWVAGAMLSMTI